MKSASCSLHRPIHAKEVKPRGKHGPVRRMVPVVRRRVTVLPKGCARCVSPTVGVQREPTGHHQRVFVVPAVPSHVAQQLTRPHCRSFCVAPYNAIQYYDLVHSAWKTVAYSVPFNNGLPIKHTENSPLIWIHTCFI